MDQAEVDHLLPMCLVGQSLERHQVEVALQEAVDHQEARAHQEAVDRQEEALHQLVAQVVSIHLALALEVEGSLVGIPRVEVALQETVAFLEVAGVAKAESLVAVVHLPMEEGFRPCRGPCLCPCLDHDHDLCRDHDHDLCPSWSGPRPSDPEWPGGSRTASQSAAPSPCPRPCRHLGQRSALSPTLRTSGSHCYPILRHVDEAISHHNLAQAA
mmetsp:Transcript_65228/g.155796  ORF Transcript_65228/g.155796 Transcript_65228/m.155796 type:complete len:214 (+) Transcript_65228:315-956(+)